MEPTYTDQTLVWTESVKNADLQQGDVVVINMKGGRIVKRIAFMAGDKIPQMEAANKWVDLIDIHENHKSKGSHTHYRDFTVPKGMVYVLGDNSPVSLDSRKFGCIPIGQIESKLVDQRPDMYI